MKKGKIGALVFSIKIKIKNNNFQ